MPTTYPKKLIEVSIPLKEINDACAREKSIRHGHPSTLHLWWARRPLAAARSVLFCQLVDDPSGYVDELVKDKPRARATEQELLMEPEGEKDLSPRLRERLIEKERERLHDLVRELVIWENTTDEKLFKRAHKEIVKTWQRQLCREGKPENTPLPPVLDPFAGGGAIPLEAQRLGMEAHASDLNPVAVLINRAMIEIPPKFAGRQPVNPDWQGSSKEEKQATPWKGAQGLAEDVRYYGEWMREEAKKRIGHLYPPYEITAEILESREDLRKAGYQVGDQLTVIAWLWARTVPSPNPALKGKAVPLVSSFWLSKKKGKEAYVEPVVENGDYRFEVRVGKADEPDKVNAGTKTGRGANFSCLLSGVPLEAKYIREEACNGNMDAVLMTVVSEGKRGRVYLPANVHHSSVAREAKPTWKPDQEVPTPCHDVDRLPMYGMPTWGDAFTDRQLVALTTFSDLVGEARQRVFEDARVAWDKADPKTAPASLEQGGTGPQAYADAVAVYLALATSRMSDSSSSLVSWTPQRDTLRNTFGRQALPMVWDFAEANVLSDSSGNFGGSINWVKKVVSLLPAKVQSIVNQANASTREINQGTIISSDPPYYDNIGYADLSDFFYVWLRRSLHATLPSAMGSILVPKEEELIASTYRQGGKANAEAFFLKGMTEVAHRWVESSDQIYPTTIYYAFKQAEIKSEGIVSTGWATFLGALMEAGFTIVGTWPMRTERPGKITAATNVLASSIILVCRQRPTNAETVTKRDFIEALESELPDALRELQHCNLSPVDLPQSAIGPGMRIFSRYAAVIQSDGAPMSVTEALQLINHELSHILDGQVSDMDEWTRFACKWFEQFAFKSGPYGDAESIANASNVAVDAVVQAGILTSGGGKVRILKPEELPGDYDPREDDNCTIWEIVHHLVRLQDSAGDQDCARLLSAITSAQAAEARQLCYRLYTVCDNNSWSGEAQTYNQLINNWTDYIDLASQLPDEAEQRVQDEMF